MSLVTDIFKAIIRSDPEPSSQDSKSVDDDEVVVNISIAEKCFDTWGISKMTSVKSVEPGNNCFRADHNIRCVDLHFYHWDFENLSWF